MNESLQGHTRQLALTLASEEGALLLARMQRLALAAARMPAPERPDGGLRLGIWDPVAHEDGTIEFTRAADTAAEWRYWADADRIPRKTAPRVVLVGESVARAYLFDPEVTLAAMLASSLGVEVVDLARTDLTAPQLPPLFDALPALEPDAVILFAGNNWSSLRFELEDLGALAEAVRAGGFAACRRLFVDTLMRGRARATLDAIAARLEGTPLCIVVPEFNLRDWRSEPAVTVPVLSDTVQWLDHKADGRTAAMIALDDGSSAVSQQMAAEAALARGDVGEARRRFEAARDALCGLMIAHSPRCPEVVQEELRSAAVRHSFTMVDLPGLFGPLPDRTLFLDYCHLTAEGLRRTAAAIAATVAPVLGVTAQSPPEVPSPVTARAHLLAAVHNAHYGQPAAIVEHHVAVALHLDPGIRETALNLVEFVCRRSEPWLCGAWTALSTEPQVRRYLGSLQMLRAPRVADTVLADAIATAARKQGLVDDLLIGEAAETPLDLLLPRHRASTFRDAVGQGLGPPLAFVRATALSSRFFVVRREAEELTGQVTLRAAGSVTVMVNGVRTDVLQAEDRWKTFVIRLALSKGRNTIDLHWPAPQVDAAATFERAARRLERGLYPDALAAFGELYAFTAG